MEFIGHDYEVSDLCMLKNHQFASSTFDSTIKIWNLQNGQCIRTLNDNVLFLAFQKSENMNLN